MNNERSTLQMSPLLTDHRRSVSEESLRTGGVRVQSEELPQTPTELPVPGSVWWQFWQPKRVLLQIAQMQVCFGHYFASIN